MDPTRQAESQRRRRMLGSAGALAALGMTALWLTVVPDKAEATDGLQSMAIRYGHPVSWGALAALGLLVATDAPRPLRSAAGAVSLGSYVAFLAALVL